MELGSFGFNIKLSGKTIRNAIKSGNVFNLEQKDMIKKFGDKTQGIVLEINEYKYASLNNVLKILFIYKFFMEIRVIKINILPNKTFISF